jgi:hypothetical protein
LFYLEVLLEGALTVKWQIQVRQVCWAAALFGNSSMSIGGNTKAPALDGHAGLSVSLQLSSMLLFCSSTSVGGFLARGCNRI